MADVRHSRRPLALSLPEALPFGAHVERPVVTETEHGFLVGSAGGGDRRVAHEVIVDLRGEAPAGDLPHERCIDGRVVRYRIDTADGGSGGTQYDLVAWDGAVGWRQGDLVPEPQPPGFELLWAVVTATRTGLDA